MDLIQSTYCMSRTIVVTKCLKLFGLYFAKPGNDDVQTPSYPENDENQRDYDDDQASYLLSLFSEITDLGCDNDNHDTTGDH